MITHVEDTYPNIHAIAGGTISGPFRDWPRVRPEAQALLERLAAVEAAVDSLSCDRGMLKSVHGALVDAGYTMGAIGRCESELVCQLTRERDEARAELASLRAQITHDPATCHVCLGVRDQLRNEGLLDGLPRLSTPEEAVRVMGDGQPW